MRIQVKVKARAKREGVEKIDETHYVVAVNEPPVDGKANQAVAEALADHLGLKRSQVRLVLGQTSRNKVFDIL